MFACLLRISSLRDPKMLVSSKVTACFGDGCEEPLSYLIVAGECGHMQRREASGADDNLRDHWIEVS